MHLALRLVVSEEYLTRVLDFVKLPGILDWNSLFNLSTPYESVYVLFIACSILGDVSEPELLKIRAEPLSGERIQWKELFVTRGGLEWAILV